jgi:vacuolar-type H+-ATPase subunit H
MGIADSIRDMAEKAKDKVDPAKAKTKEGIEKAGDKVDEATSGKYKEHVDRGQNAAKSGVDKVSGGEHGGQPQQPPKPQ